MTWGSSYVVYHQWYWEGGGGGGRWSETLHGLSFTSFDWTPYTFLSDFTIIYINLLKSVGLLIWRYIYFHTFVILGIIILDWLCGRTADGRRRTRAPNYSDDDKENLPCYHIQYTHFIFIYYYICPIPGGMCYTSLALISTQYVSANQWRGEMLHIHNFGANQCRGDMLHNFSANQWRGDVLQNFSANQWREDVLQNVSANQWRGDVLQNISTNLCRGDVLHSFSANQWRGDVLHNF